VKISSVSQDLGDSEVDLPSEVSGEVLEGEIIFNHRYILEALNVMTEEKVGIQIVNDSTAVILKGRGNDNLTCLVMPIKT
jgi:DNA polymerase III sliding clamp (beta) subunit (PCNA family)